MTRKRSSAVPRVLLVDGPLDDRQMYAEYLDLRRFAVLEVENAAEALACADRADVIVTGIRLPGPFDGIELVRRLREHEQTRHKPIIVLTACAFEPDQQRAWAAGASAFLPKPCLPETLVAQIQQALAVARRPQPAAACLKRPRRDVA